MNKVTKYIFSTILGAMMIGTTVSAAEYTVTDVNAVLYTNSKAVMYTEPDENSVFMTAEQVQDGLAIMVTGITSNGYFRVDVGAGQPYYFNGEGMSATLEETTAENTQKTTENAQTTVQNNNLVMTTIEDYPTGDGKLRYTDLNLPIINSDTDPYGRFFDDTPESIIARVDYALKNGLNYIDYIDAKNITRQGLSGAEIRKLVKNYLPQYEFKREWFLPTTMYFKNTSKVHAESDVPDNFTVDRDRIYWY